MESEKILIVEDEAEIRELIELYLKSAGYQVVFAEDGKQALEVFEQTQPDFVILDILLPELNGFQVCQQLRKISSVPVLFLSCKQDSDDIIQGLELGGDDYLTKPFDPGVLLARVKARLRRVTSTPNKDLLIYDDLVFDLQKLSISLRGVDIMLPAKERQLLFFLAQHPDHLFSLEDLYFQVWGKDSFGDTRTVMVHLSNIRKKIEDDPSEPKYIQNIRGLGYMFQTPKHAKQPVTKN